MSHSLSISRFIDASPEVVWDVLANRQNEWWCPTPWRAEVDEQDRRPGGVCKMTMYGPDGEVMPQNGMYLAYEEGRRFVTTDAIVDDFEPSGPFMIGIWEIAPEGTGTRYTATARHWSEEACRQHEEMGFLDGWNACAEQLAALCENDKA
ncbi:SRPBCC family protein [Novosphingobium aquimarinum]|uniref:SRPBCC family protein n=1 Tax=Novosphingobium aquimarinum TaxID=2682494 RepID=UPI0018DB5296|nr:SRPBCC family protein [Novosphingobium aquimarinum]